MRRVLRNGVIPSVLGGLTAAALVRAFSGEQLLVPAVVAIAAGLVAGTAMGSRRMPLLVSAPASVLAAYIASVLLSGAWSPTAVPDAIYLFLTVGLPASGLDSPALVTFTLTHLTTASAAALALRGRTLASLVAPMAVLVATALAVVPVGVSWAVPAGFVAAAGLALLLEARVDLSQLPPLMDQTIEAKRRVVWWRPLFQLVPAVTAVALAAVLRPVERAVDVRDALEPAGVVVDQVSPLAAVARASRVPTAEAEPLALVEVSGGEVGRLRMAVLDLYDGTAWRQSAEFTETGERLAPDPLFDERFSADHPSATAQITVTPAARAPLTAVPTATGPVAVGESAAMRFAPEAQVLLAKGRTGAISYRALQARPVEAIDATVGRFPPELVSCPASEPIRAVASQLAAGTTDARERLARIESFLKVRRVFDPAAPGGQTLRSVERFVEQDFARGNLEVFVSAYALLARCAGVPARVAVGLPAPRVGASRFTDRDLTAWVETPLARSGWVVVEPLPTPEEQRQQAQLARRPDPATPPTTAPPNPAASPQELPPLDIADRGSSIALRVVALLLSVACLPVVLWAWGAPWAVRARRRRTAGPTAAVLAAWQSVADAMADRDLPVEVHHTPTEVARAITGNVPQSVSRLVAVLAPLADTARYSGNSATESDARRAWSFADAIVAGLPRTPKATFIALLQPRLVLARLASTRNLTSAS